MQSAVMRNQSVLDLKMRMREHIRFIASERLEYQKKRDRAILRTNDCWSSIIDGVDETSYSPYNFTVPRKEQRGHRLKVKLIDVLEHGKPNTLNLYKLTEEHQTVSNHIAEAIHRYLTDRHLRGNLPMKLFIQMDSWFRKNQNRSLLFYLESLVAWRAFEEIDVVFLPIGHTHEYIDQYFSWTSPPMRSNEAIALQDLRTQLRQTYYEYTTMAHISNAWCCREVFTKCNAFFDVKIFQNWHRLTQSKHKRGTLNDMRNQGWCS